MRGRGASFRLTTSEPQVYEYQCPSRPGASTRYDYLRAIKGRSNVTNTDIRAVHWPSDNTNTTPELSRGIQTLRMPISKPSAGVSRGGGGIGGFQVTKSEPNVRPNLFETNFRTVDKRPNVTNTDILAVHGPPIATITDLRSVHGHSNATNTMCKPSTGIQGRGGGNSGDKIRTQLASKRYEYRPPRTPKVAFERYGYRPPGRPVAVKRYEHQPPGNSRAVKRYDYKCLSCPLAVKRYEYDVQAVPWLSIERGDGFRVTKSKPHLP